jgi:hypothetical protein
MIVLQAALPIARSVALVPPCALIADRGVISHLAKVRDVRPTEHFGYNPFHFVMDYEEGRAGTHDLMHSFKYRRK